MGSSSINFTMISRALSVSIEALQREKHPSVLAIQKLKEAQEELQQALSFSSADRY